MPEYLSPGVYVEEVNSGSKPIEGVSTSTTGMVGVTERGPENVPVLVTSNGEYRRVYGGELQLFNFTDGNNRIHAYMPHAVQGFFQNDGRRNYVVRVLPEDAERAQRELFDRGDVASVETQLLRQAPQDTGTAVNTPLLYVLNPGALAVGDSIRMGDGSRAEYRQVANLSAGAIHEAIGTPLAASYAIDPAIEVFGMTAAHAGLADFQLVEDAQRGDITITVQEGAAGEALTLAGLADPVLEIGNTGVSEFIRATNVIANGNQAIVTLQRSLSADLVAAVVLPVRVIAAPAALAGTSQLEIAAGAGEQLLYAVDSTVFVGADWLVIGDTSLGSTNFEVHQLANLGAISLDVPAYDDYPLRSQIQLVGMLDDSQIVGAVTDGQVFDVIAVDNLEIGMAIDVNGQDGLIQDITGSQLTLVDPLVPVPGGGELVTPFSLLTADANANSVVLSLSNRVGLEVGSVLRIGLAPNEEYVEIVNVVGERGVAPDAGTVVLSTALAQTHLAGTRVVHQDEPLVDNARQAAHTVVAAEAGEGSLFISDDANYVAGDIIRLVTPGGVSFFHRLLVDATAINPATVELDEALDFSHGVGSPMEQREALIEVLALDRGAWGNRLQVSVADVETSLVQANLDTANGLNPVISLSNYTNVEAGTVLEFFDANAGDVLGTPAKVVSVDRAAGEVELDAVLHGDIVAAHANPAITVAVRSREFVVNVFLLQRPDPAVPSRNNTVIDSESFIVTLDPRHSRYIHRIIGTTWDQIPGVEQDHDGNDLRLWDRRSEGESRYIRVRDVAAGNIADLESIRLGPEILEDRLDNGQMEAARLPLADGGEGFTSIINDAQGDNMYLGVNSDEPRLRTGIHALRNIQDISIVAVPGQTTVGVQQGLINHCENDRYRFAVLDAHAPNQDTLVDVQIQRQAFDTRYAALYHPWLTIPEPLPQNIASIRQMPVPPSGYMMGIYARVDNNRGVHKAPANEVVRGITGLTRSLNKREQDILNPFPKNINVVRDFREANRGLRVWGARCITSDSDYKYVNVRRLMIFLEASIDRGLQWVVFEPNADPLWARVRRSVTNFLNVVWRNGALEGTTPDQAFFVRCDRTTMTQTDIDNGRLICEIGVAPVKPAEFVIVRIGLWTASAD